MAVKIDGDILITCSGSNKLPIQCQHIVSIPIPLMMQRKWSLVMSKHSSHSSAEGFSPGQKSDGEIRSFLTLQLTRVVHSSFCSWNCSSSNSSPID